MPLNSLMRGRQKQFCIFCGLTLLTATGCHSYHPHGYGGYPGVYSAPPAGALPPPSGGSYVAPGTPVQPGTPQPIQPGTQPPGSVPGQIGPGNQWQQSPPSGPTPLPDGSPFYQYNDGSQNQPGDNLVPPYGDPDDDFESLDGPSSGGNDANDSETDSPFGFDSRSGAPSDNIGMTAATEVSAEPQAGAAAASQQASLTQETAEWTETAAAADASQPNPYDYDQQNYQWLRGKVDYDEEDESWHIIYSLSPDESDQFQGSMMLVADEKLAVLDEDDIVLLEGRIDPNLRDRRGKPCYRVDHLARLRHKSAILTTSSRYRP